MGARKRRMSSIRLSFQLADRTEVSRATPPVHDLLLLRPPCFPAKQLPIMEAETVALSVGAAPFPKATTSRASVCLSWDPATSLARKRSGFAMVPVSIQPKVHVVSAHSRDVESSRLDLKFNRRTFTAMWLFISIGTVVPFVPSQAGVLFALLFFAAAPVTC